MSNDESNDETASTGQLAPGGEAPRGTPGKRHRLATALRIGLSIAVILLLMLWVFGFFRKNRIQPGRAAVPERKAEGLPTLPVTFTTIPVTAEAVGTVRPEYVATVTSRVVATIVRIGVSAGQRVAKGEILVELDDRDLRARVEQAREAVRAAEATFAQALSNYKRDKPLFDQRVISAYDFENTETALKTAQANLERLRQAQHEAEANLSYAVIRSPFDGVVIDKLSETGELAAPGKPLLTMYQQDRLWLEASVPEEQLGRISIGRAYPVRIDALKRTLHGRVAEIVPSSDPATRTVLVRVRLENPRDLVPGMFGRLLIPEAPQRVLLIPAPAVRRAGQLTTVDVVQDGRVERRTVQLGRAVGDKIEVLSGLAPGEVIVAETAEATTTGQAK
jgi:RND family efflux transporter MFP subunit